MWYVVVPLDCEATRAVPSGSNSTSPASTSLTAESTRPLHSGNFARALSAISATAARHKARLLKPGEETSSQENSFTATIVMPFSTQRVLYLAVGKFAASQRPLCFNMTFPCFALRLPASSPCRSRVSALSRPLSLAQRHRHVVSIVYSHLRKYAKRILHT